MKRLLIALLPVIFRVASACAAPDLSAASFDPQPGAMLPIDSQLTDDNRRQVRLGEFFTGKPVVIALGYFHCPNLCGVVRDDLFSALAETGLRTPRDYTVLVVSIDPAEGPMDAAKAKQDELARYPTPDASDGWHFLTGASNALQHTIGYRATFDAQGKQFIHPAGVVVTTPWGAVSGYLLGVGYRPMDLRQAITRAASSGIAPAPSPVLLLCFHYDATTGRYTLAIERVLSWFAGLTVLTLGGMLVMLHRRPPQA
jgi:protein SCO1